MRVVVNAGACAEPPRQMKQQPDDMRVGAHGEVEMGQASKQAIKSRQSRGIGRCSLLESEKQPGQINQSGSMLPNPWPVAPEQIRRQF